MKRILVTGGAGYIGSVLCRKLLKAKYKVRVIDHLRFGQDSLHEILNHPDFELIVADIRDRPAVDQAMKDVDGVVHLASIVGDPACQKEPQLAKETNLDASKYLLAAARNNKAQRFVFASTCSNYGKMLDPNGSVDEDSPLRPVSLYAQLKVEFENHMLNADYPEDFTVVGLRFATAYGLSPRMRFDLTVNEFTKDMTLGKELIVFGEQFWRPYCHIEDLSQSCLTALEAPRETVHKNVFNVGDNEENYQKKTIVELLEKRLPEAKYKYVHKDEDPRDYRVNFDKIRRDLGFKVSKNVPNGIDEIMAALRSGSLKDPDSAAYKNI